MSLIQVLFLMIICSISRATNINISFRPKHWSRWTKRSFTTSHHHYHHENSNNANKSQSAYKGKLHKIQKLKWGAGAGWTILSILDWWLLAAGGFLKWTPIGICIVAATHLYLHNKECTRKGLPRTAPAWQVNKFFVLM